MLRTAHTLIQGMRLSIIVEHGGSGSKAAAPIAKKLFKLIIDRHDLRNEQSNFERITV